MSPSGRFLLPDLGEGLTEAEVVAWHVGPGDTVTLNQVLLEVETEKATVELPSPFAGTVTSLLAEAGETVEVGAPLVAIELAGPEQVPTLVGYGPIAQRSSRRGRRPARAPRTPTAPAAGGRPLAAPPVRFMARQHGVDLAQVRGGGPDGVITREDLAAHLASRTGPVGPVEGTLPPAALREARQVPRGVRKHMAEAMARSAATAPQASIFLTVDATATSELVARLRADPRLAGTRITPLTVVARATVLALQAHPALNASWDDATGEIVTKHYVNLGVAVAGPRGLIVPNVKEAQAMSLPVLAAALQTLTERARAGRSSPNELRGGTATITNIGVFGVDAGVPVLNPGEAAILAYGSIRPRPWEHAGSLALRDVVTLTTTFDHRLADGEQAARFLGTIGELLRDPGAIVTSS